MVLIPTRRDQTLDGRPPENSGWPPQRDSNPCFSLERAVSWSTLTANCLQIATSRCRVADVARSRRGLAFGWWTRPVSWRSCWPAETPETNKCPGVSTADRWHRAAQGFPTARAPMGAVTMAHDCQGAVRPPSSRDAPPRWRPGLRACARIRCARGPSRRRGGRSSARS